MDSRADRRRVPTLKKGWIGGLGGAAALTGGIVLAALMATAIVGFHGGAPKLRAPGIEGKVALAQGGHQTGSTGTSAAAHAGSTQASTRNAARTRRSAARSLGHLDGHRQLRRRGGGTLAPTPEGTHHAESPAGSAPPTSAPAAAPPSNNPGGGGPTGGGDVTQRSSTPVGDTVRNTTQALGDTLGGATQTVGNTVSTVSPALSNTVNQAAPVLDNTVKNTGDAVGGALDGLLGGGHR
jgi:hypothetical protein